MSKTAVIILNWNGVSMLARYLPKLIDYSRDEAEIIIADNASTDNSLEMVRERYPRIRLIPLDKNWGFAEGYNKALAMVDADYFLLLNSDIEVTHHWLTPLIEFMDNHAEAAACQPKILSIADRDRFEYAGAAGGYIDCLGYPYCRGRLFDTVERDDGQYDYCTEVHWASGAALMIRRADFVSAGGFDGRFFAHNEEIDLCWRLRLLGRKIFCVPESVVYHVGGGTLPKVNPMKTFLNFRNNLTMLYKCLPESSLKRVMRWRRLLDYTAAWETLIVNRNIGDFLAIYRARRAFSRWKKDFAADRERIQRSAVGGKSLLSPFSLLWRYYVKGEKHFSHLKQ